MTIVMQSTKVYSFLSDGLTPKAVEVQIHLRTQLPGFIILGLPGPEIQEARERIMAAFHSSEIEFPRKKVIVNLAPSDLKKSGTGHDLAMAVSIILEHHREKLPFDPTTLFAWGALGLKGEVRSCGRMATLMDLLLESPEIQTVLLAQDDAELLQRLFAWRKERGLIVPSDLKIGILNQLSSLFELSFASPLIQNQRFQNDSDTETLHSDLLLPLSHQERLLKIALTGRHHTLILGPKGVGKSQLIGWFETLSPKATAQQSWKRWVNEDQVRNDSKTYGELPVRMVHSQVKPAHLLGGWSNHAYRPGELSRAHGGILIADEFLEWHRDSKECLREPLQRKKSNLTRTQGTLEFECDFQLVGTGNLCPCGGLPPQFRSSRSKLGCRCSGTQIEDYLNRLSGPIADRIDLVTIHGQEVTPEKKGHSESRKIQKRNELKNEILEARQFSLKTFGKLSGDLDASWLEETLTDHNGVADLFNSGSYSLRSRHKILKVARTIQALEKSPELKLEHVLEAKGFRFELNTRTAASQHSSSCSEYLSSHHYTS